ncbi:MAG: tRNA (guanosine(37)-N1)-methyltransferase TrmD [Deltaproteobacteria bacterium]|nr:tRNA (guanosine(37)-N1)-methyltransferase TrmD [Deltaproteobacteria bacterium]
MFKFHIATIFPELFNGFVEASLIGKAARNRLVEIEIIDLRDFTHDRHMSVDDAPYGGGSGMVMRPGPIFEWLDDLPPCHRILLTPQGRPFSQESARRLLYLSPIALFCGRYEGVDERARGRFDEEISLGDFVLNGGEVGAMAIIEAVSRLVPGVLGNAESVVEESFTDGTLEYPQYTRPESINGLSVPEVLLSGDHGRVARWRRGQALLRTRTRRPDLFERLELTENDIELLKIAETESNDE